MKCPKCGNEYEDSFNFCPDCKEPNLNRKSTNRCPKCDAEYDFSFKFCPECAEANPIIQEEVSPASQQVISTKTSWFGWKHITIGVGILLAIIGITLGLVFGLGGGESVVGTYFNSESGLTLVLSKDGEATLRSEETDNITGSYVVKEDYVKIWNPSKGSEETMKGLQLRIVDKNLIDDDEDIWVRDGESEETTSSEVETPKKAGFTVGKYVWEDETSGDGMTFNADGTWDEIQNGVATNSGTYTVIGDTVNMTFSLPATSMSEAVTTEWPLKIEGNKLIDPKDNKNLVKE